MRRSQRGFTLLEMLVAIAIFALVAIMAHTGLRSVLNNRLHVEQQADRLQQLQLAITLIGRDLVQAVPRPIRDEFGDRQPALQGGGSFGEGRLELTHAGWRNPAGQPRSELQRVAYRLGEEGLERWSWQVLDRAQDSEPYRALLLDGVDELSFRFMDEQRQWHDHWPVEALEGDLARLPRAIEVILQLDGRGTIRRLWPLVENPPQRLSAEPPQEPEQ